MKKIICIIIIVLLSIGILGTIGYGIVTRNDNKEVKLEEKETTIEDMISQDMVSMDSVINDYTFFESRIVLRKPFNESDSLDVVEVTNVFQFLVKDSIGNTQPNVYMFVHDSIGNTTLDKHPNAFIVSDQPLIMDSIKIDFKKMFELSRSSNFPPSKSRYITLRKGLGKYECNPFYTIGNEEMGHMWVDAVTGEVMVVDPSSIKK